MKAKLLVVLAASLLLAGCNSGGDPATTANPTKGPQSTTVTSAATTSEPTQTSTSVSHDVELPRLTFRDDLNSLNVTFDKTNTSNNKKTTFYNQGIKRKTVNDTATRYHYLNFISNTNKEVKTYDEKGVYLSTSQTCFTKFTPSQTFPQYMASSVAEKVFNLDSKRSIEGQPSIFTKEEGTDYYKVEDFEIELSMDKIVEVYRKTDGSKVTPSDIEIDEAHNKYQFKDIKVRFDDGELAYMKMTYSTNTSFNNLSSYIKVQVSTDLTTFEFNFRDYNTTKVDFPSAIGY